MKKKVIVLLLGLAIMNLCYSKNFMDKMMFRFVSDVQAKAFEKSTRLNSDEHWLDIGENGVSKYYSRWKNDYWHINDSLKAIGGDFNSIQRVVREKGIESSQFNYYIYKNYPSQRHQTVDYYSIELFQYQEPMGQDWELAEGDTTILNHPCHKAVCNYHGRTWTAYYATDIPISDGPWKLCGLPGLILRAYDHDGAFIINCIGIHQEVGGEITMRDAKKRKMKPEQAHKLIELIDSDPDAYMESQGHKSTTYDEKGRPMKMPQMPKRAYYESYSSGDRK